MQDGARNTGYLGLQVSDLVATNFANSQNYLRVGVYYYNTVSNRYRYWNGAIWHNGMSSVSLDDAYNDGNQINIGVNPVQLSSVAPNNAVLATDEGGGNNAVLFSNGNLVLGGAAMLGGERLRVVGDGYISGDLIVKGTFFTTEAEVVKINDNHLYLNNGYTLNIAQTGGLVVNYLPTAVTDTIAGAFTAGVAAVSNPTVITTGVGTYAVGDLIQISGANKDENNGLFEVLSHVGNTLTIRGIGVTATVEDFTQNQFVNDAVVLGDIVQVTVSVIRAGVDGLWEDGQGAVTPVVFTDIAHAPGGFVTLDSAYDGGGAGLGRQIAVDSRSVQLNADISTILNNEEVFFANITGAEISGTRTNGIYVFSDHTMNHANSEFQGIEVELSSMTLTNFSNLWGVSIALGALLSAGGGEVNGIHATSDSGTVKILTNDGLISAILADVPGSLVRIGAPTTAINVDLLVNGITGIEVTDPLTDDTHALIITRQNTVQNLGMRAGSAVALSYTIGAMDVGILASSIMNEVFDNAGALGGTLTGMTLLLDGVSGSLAQKQGIRMILSGAMDSGVDDEGYFLSASHTIDNAGQFHGFYGDLQSLGLTSYSYISGLQLLMPDDSLAVNSPIRGILVTMPVGYSGSDMVGAEISGNGNLLFLCNNTWTIEAQIGNVAIDQGQLIVNGTVFNTNERIRLNLNADAQHGIYIDADTNPLTVGCAIEDILIQLNQPTGNIYGLLLTEYEAVANTNVITYFGTYLDTAIVDGTTMATYGHYMVLQGQRKGGGGYADRGMFIEATHEIDDVASVFEGIVVYAANMTVTNYQFIYGINITMPDDALVIGSPIRGINVMMPVAYSGGDMAGIEVQGDGQGVKICNGQFALEANGDVYISGKLTVTGLIDPTGLYLDEQGADQPNIANKGVLYTKDVATVTELFYRDSAGAVTQLTGGGSLSHSLDQAYDDGRTITADAGAVVINNAVNNASNSLELSRTLGTGNALNITLGASNPGIYINNTTTTATAGKNLVSANANLSGVAAPFIGYYTEISETGANAGAQIYGAYVKTTAISTSTAEIVSYMADIRGQVDLAVTHRGYYVYNNAMTLNNVGAILYNMHLQGHNLTLTAFSKYYGAYIQQPVAYPAGDIVGIKVEGDGRTVQICDNTYAIYCQGEARFTSYLDMTGGSGFWFRPPSMTSAQRTAMTAAWGAGDAAKMWFNTTTSQWEGWDGTIIVIIG